jgi:hypothetical protein
MAYNNDWMPGPRSDQLALCQVWNLYLTAARRTAWGVPQDQYNELVDLFDDAKALLQKAQNEAERTRYQNPPSVADFGTGVCAKRKLHLSACSGQPGYSGVHAA